MVYSRKIDPICSRLCIDRRSQPSCTGDLKSFSTILRPVIFDDLMQILADLQTKMRAVPHYLCPSITEAWLRRYQVLPGRTHPTMVTSGTGGFILHAIKVYVNECNIRLRLTQGY